MRITCHKNYTVATGQNDKVKINPAGFHCLCIISRPFNTHSHGLQPAIQTHVVSMIDARSNNTLCNASHSDLTYNLA